MRIFERLEFWVGRPIFSPAVEPLAVIHLETAMTQGVNLIGLLAR